MATSDDGFTPSEAVFVDGDMLAPESSDPVLSQPDPPPTTSKEEAEESKDESGNGPNNLKSAFIISGVVVAVIGAIFAIAKKIKGPNAT